MRRATPLATGHAALSRAKRSTAVQGSHRAASLHAAATLFTDFVILRLTAPEVLPQSQSTPQPTRLLDVGLIGICVDSLRL